MFIIWGTRARSSKEGTLEHSCLICPNSSLQVYSWRKWFTFFFIPVFPISSRSYYVECRDCENSYTFKGIQEVMQHSNFIKE